MLELEVTTGRLEFDRTIRSHFNPEAIYDAISQLEGVELVERRRFEHQTKCAEFVFNEQSQEQWLSEETEAMWDNPLKFLQAHGYSLEDEPMEGDIVAYACKTPEETGIGPVDDQDFAGFAAKRKLLERQPPYFQHFGIYRRGKVLSKFNEGHVYLHDLSMIPSNYGSQVYFFRKTS